MLSGLRKLPTGGQGGGEQPLGRATATGLRLFRLPAQLQGVQAAEEGLRLGVL